MCRFNTSTQTRTLVCIQIRNKQMKKIACLVAALSLSLLLSTAAFAGEILTPGVTAPPPPPAEATIQVAPEVSGLAESTGDVMPGIDLLYFFLETVF